MNKLSELITRECEKSLAMKYDDAMEYITTGSIIAFTNFKEEKNNCDLHGSLPAKIFIMMECIRTVAHDYNVDYREICDFMKSYMEDHDEDYGIH